MSKKKNDNNQAKPPTQTKQTVAQDSDLIAPNQTLTIKLKWEQVAPAYDKAVEKLAKQLKLDGFRQGKVPPKIAKSYLNPETVINRTLEKILPQAFLDAVKKINHLPIASPEYQAKSVEEEQDWEIEAIYATQPEIKLGNYQKICQTAIAQAKKSAKQQKNAEPDKEKGVILGGIYQALVAKIKPKIPELLVKRETQYDIERLANELKQHNLTLSDYLAKTQMKPEQLSQDMAARALGRLQLTFILQQIAKQAKLQVGEDELKRYLKNQSARPELVDYIKESLLRQKIADHLLAFAK